MRKWHRWVSLLGILFLLVVGTSGLILQVQGLLNADEQKLELIKSQKSKVTLSKFFVPASIESARNSLSSKIGEVGIKKIEIEFRQTPSIITFYTDEEKPRVFQIDTATSKIISEKENDENNFWIKLHSGELFGDVGRVLGIFSGSVLLLLSISGFWIYFQMYQRRPKGIPLWNRFFW